MSVDAAISDCDVRERLSAAQVAPTRQRLAVGRILFRAPVHLSADEILQRVRAENLRVSKATVYNTLALFVRRGLVREVMVDTTQTLYDSNTEPHHHLYNVDNHTLTDLPTSALPLSEHQLAAVAAAAGSAVELLGVDVVIRVKSTRLD